jgi:murein DD-endopeptidase MepM/ murein hydrolase activator NlpD
VDYAGAIGTPVRTVGDGVVEFAGVQNGYGNVIIVKHQNQNETLYAHLSKIDVRVGQAVGQGDRIGAVGMTGWSTGPHLHFEFRVNGVHQDPLTIARQNDSQPVSPTAKATFNQLSSVMRQQLSAATSIQQASAD